MNTTVRPLQALDENGEYLPEECAGNIHLNLVQRKGK